MGLLGIVTSIGQRGQKSGRAFRPILGIMVTYPRHEQHYPTKLLPSRIEEYIREGLPPTADRRAATLLTGQQVLDAVIRAQGQLGLTAIDPRYYIGTCFHEAGCLNEWDTEVATASCPPGFVSVGPYQIGDEEARRYGFRLEDMIDLDKATECMVRMTEDSRRGLRAAAGLSDATPDPDHVDLSGRRWPGGVIRAYLAIAHNKGMGFARLTIQRFQMDWALYKERNPLDNIVDHGYGDDCITGGPQWPGADQPRLLLLTQPRMTGPDVIELQVNLSVHGVKVAADGVFGPVTDQAVRSFQRAHGLIVDGKVGASTHLALASPP